MHNPLKNTTIPLLVLFGSSVKNLVVISIVKTQALLLPRLRWVFSFFPKFLCSANIEDEANIINIKWLENENYLAKNSKVIITGLSEEVVFTNFKSHYCRTDWRSCVNELQVIIAGLNDEVVFTNSNSHYHRADWRSCVREL